MKKSLTLVMAILLVPVLSWADIPATPVMTLYQFGGATDIPFYAVETFEKRGPTSPAGTLAQGGSVIPCLVLRNGRPLTDSSGTPYVGFDVVVDARTATPTAVDAFNRAAASRKVMAVRNHHCGADVQHVIDVRKMYALGKPPIFDIPRTAMPTSGGADDTLDDIVRAFHNAPLCEKVNRALVDRRAALSRSWERFIAENGRRWPRDKLERAKHLDYTMRTALFEGHLDRGCGAYGACERNIIALSIRNRGREACSRHQGCSFPDDFQGVATKVSQYNIWDEFLTQISGITSCFLNERAGHPDDRVRAMYEQNVADVERILFGTDRDLEDIFPHTPPGSLKSLRHYYHAPAMGKCFPRYPRVEYITGAVAAKGGDYALIANTRIEVGKKIEGGYLFREFKVTYESDRDVVRIVDNYPGFVVDGAKVSLKSPTGCYPYGVPRGCAFKKIERYRKVPPWLKAGRSIAITCTVHDRGEDCLGRGMPKTVTVGGPCDTDMRPVAGVR